MLRHHKCYKNEFKSVEETDLYTGADLGGRTPPYSGIRTPANPKGPPFGTF